MRRESSFAFRRRPARRTQEVGSLSGSLLGRIEWNENDPMDRTVNVVAGQHMGKDSTDLVYPTHNPLVEGSIPSSPTNLKKSARSLSALEIQNIHLMILTRMGSQDPPKRDLRSQSLQRYFGWQPHRQLDYSIWLQTRSSGTT